MINLTVDSAEAEATALVKINLVLLHAATNTYFFLLLVVKGPKQSKAIQRSIC